MFAGTHPGVYQGMYVIISYATVKPQLMLQYDTLISENVPNRLQSKASTVRFNSEEDARLHFGQAVESGKVTIITNGGERVFTMKDMELM